jgi:hypothetical protein
MATIHVLTCDHCQKPEPKADDIRQVTIQVSGEPSYEHDLCTSCRAQLDQFMNAWPLARRSKARGT